MKAITVLLPVAAGRWVGAVLTLTLALTEVGPTSAAWAGKLAGPKRVTPGKQVTFRATGFPVNEGVLLTLIPTSARNTNCCGAPVFDALKTKRVATDDEGNARLPFRWPRRYATCGIDSARDRCYARWKPGSRADVLVCVRACIGVGGPVRKVVRIRKSSPKPITIPVRGQRAIFEVACTLARTCAARVTVKSGGATVARGRYSVPAGKTRKVRLELTEAGRKAFDNSRRLNGKATIVDSGTGKRKTLPVVLRRR